MLPNKLSSIIFICILCTATCFASCSRKDVCALHLNLKPKVHADIPCGSNQIHVVAMLNLSFLTNVEISWIYTYIPNKEKKNRFDLLCICPFLLQTLYYCSNRPDKKKYRTSMALPSRIVQLRRIRVSTYATNNRPKQHDSLTVT